MKKVTHIGEGEVRSVVHPENRGYDSTRHQIAITAGWLAFNPEIREDIKDLLFDTTKDDAQVLDELESMSQQQHDDVA